MYNFNLSLPFSLYFNFLICEDIIKDQVSEYIKNEGLCLAHNKHSILLVTIINTNLRYLCLISKTLLNRALGIKYIKLCLLKIP